MIQFALSLALVLALSLAPQDSGDKSSVKTEAPVYAGASISNSGFLSAYDENPTVGTIAYHQNLGNIPDDLTGYDGLIVVYDCSRIGQDALLTVGDETWETLVFDCAGEADGGQDWMTSNGYVAEIDYYMWQKYPHILGKYATVTYMGDE